MTLPAMENESGPESLTMAIPASPGAVDIAAIVSLLTFTCGKVAQDLENEKNEAWEIKDSEFRIQKMIEDESSCSTNIWGALFLLLATEF